MMAKKDPLPPAGSRSRQRGKPVQVQAKTPWGFIAGASVLGLLLVGVLVYAVTNSGAGFQDPLQKADKSFGTALVKADKASLTRNHVTTDVTYPASPPNGGDHNPVWEDCGVYTAQVPDEYAVHSQEHGAVWVTYRPDLPAAQVKKLTDAVKGKPYTLLSPYPGQTSPIDLSAWGRRVSVKTAGDPLVAKFVKTYADGPQTPEKGAACTGGTTATGAKPQGATTTPQAKATVPVG
ncbi:MAG: hypothetical protein JWN17_2612 [Frankiales bacterium]|nr:hypothetical protein [Frankiales bacterium]